MKGHTQSIAIGAGKGGVGKSTVTVNVALALLAEGARVGILDADLYGPSIGKMVALEHPLREEDGYIIPAQGLGLFVVSLAHFSLGEQATIVRAPIANQIIGEFLHQVLWPELDFLLIDFPPGTGDVQLTLMQQAALAGAILVTTPQEVALLDVTKAHAMFQAMQVPVLGIVENMSYFEEGGERYYPLGQGGGRRFCQQHQLRLLGEIPLDKAVSACSDEGSSLLAKHPKAVASDVFTQVAKGLQQGLLQGKSSPVSIKKMTSLDELFIEWNDGMQSRYPWGELQQQCPCQRCRHKKQNASKELRPLVKVKNILSVGNYALRIEFEQGCSQGIYSFELLRKLSKVLL